MVNFRWLPMLAAMLVLGGLGQTAQGGSADAAAPKAETGRSCICDARSTCACQTADEILDPDVAFLDGDLLRALMSVVNYRGTKQRNSLRVTEQTLSNFRISVSRRNVARKPGAYSVVFAIKSFPGDPIVPLAGTKRGNSYEYFVDKRTFEVVEVVKQE